MGNVSLNDVVLPSIHDGDAYPDARFAVERSCHDIKMNYLSELLANAETVKPHAIKALRQSWGKPQCWSHESVGSLELDDEEKRLLEGTVLVAENLGDYYPSSFSAAIREAVSQFIDEELVRLQEDLDELKEEAISEVHKAFDW